MVGFCLRKLYTKASCRVNIFLCIQAMLAVELCGFLCYAGQLPKTLVLVWP